MVGFRRDHLVQHTMPGVEGSELAAGVTLEVQGQSQSLGPSARLLDAEMGAHQPHGRWLLVASSERAATNGTEVDHIRLYDLSKVASKSRRSQGGRWRSTLFVVRMQLPQRKASNAMSTLLDRLPLAACSSGTNSAFGACPMLT